MIWNFKVLAGDFIQSYNRDYWFNWGYFYTSWNSIFFAI